jgi:hypothetical protein
MSNHLRAINMSYFEHLVFAWRTAAGLMVHGLFPDLLVTYASDRLCERDTENSTSDSTDDFSPYNTSNS